MQRTIAVLLCALLLFSGAAFPAAAADDAYTYPEPEVLEIDLYIQPYHYLEMISGTDENKHPAIVCINGGETQEIGIQVRGDSSLREGLETPGKRIPFELCFDYADASGNFRGNPSLKLINCQTPARLLIQYIAMLSYAFSGVPTPRITPAFIRINDTDFGLYLAVEDLNEAFVQDRFAGASLYRPLAKQDTPAQTVPFEGGELLVKADHGNETVLRYADARRRGENVDRYLDVDEILRFFACETFLDNADGFLSRSRNFYLADNNGKLSLLPWDTDYVFETLSKGGEWSDFAQYDAPLFRYLMEDETNRLRYREYLRQLNDVFLNPETFLPWLEGCIRTVSPYFQRDMTIDLRSQDVYADLTSGAEVYNTQSGNLMLTFEVYHKLMRRMLSGDTTSFSELKEDAVASVKVKKARQKTRVSQPDRSVIARICQHYWSLRRQVFEREYGSQLLMCGGFFGLVFCIAVWSVHRHAGHKGKCTQSKHGLSSNR